MIVHPVQTKLPSVPIAPLVVCVWQIPSSKGILLSKEEWRCASIRHGELCAVTGSIKKMLAQSVLLLEGS